MFNFQRRSCDARAVGRYANHGLQICSCYMCGNPRRTGAVSMQERRAQFDLNAAQNFLRAFDREDFN